MTCGGGGEREFHLSMIGGTSVSTDILFFFLFVEDGLGSSLCWLPWRHGEGTEIDREEGKRVHVYSLFFQFGFRCFFSLFLSGLHAVLLAPIGRVLFPCMSFCGCSSQVAVCVRHCRMQLMSRRKGKMSVLCCLHLVFTPPVPLFCELNSSITCTKSSTRAA